MKFSTSLGLAVAPLAMARNVQNIARGSGPGPEKRMMSDDLSGYGITANCLTDVMVMWANPGGGSATTTYNSQAATETAAAAAATYTVTVGGSAGLVYQPSQLDNVCAGDMVVFQFMSQNHTATQSSFDTPCVKLEGGMDTGFQPNPNNTISPPPMVAMQINNVSAPLWFYCRQTGHCGQGMVFSINPTAQKSQAEFQQMAVAQNGTSGASPGTNGTAYSPDQYASAQYSSAYSSASSVYWSASSIYWSASSAYWSASPATATSAGAAQQTYAAGDSASGVTVGNGTVGADGSCSCVVQCNPGSFPASSQGIGAYGGWGGSLPMPTGYKS